MNFIYIGSPRPDSETDKLLQLGSNVNFAGNTLQDAILCGLSKHLNFINIISGWAVTPFPKVKRLIFKRRIVENNDKRRYIYVGGWNIPIINLMSRFFRCYRELKEMLSKQQDNFVLIYEVHTPFLLAAALLKKRIEHICLIVPDLPQFMSGNTGLIHNILKKLDSRIIHKCLRKIDSYVLLSQGMCELLPIGKKPYIIMEGIFNPVGDLPTLPREQLKTIMYAGGIYKRRGTDVLLNAFSRIKSQDYRLWIRGDGDMKEEIIKMSREDKRITYFPPMTREKLLDLEGRATVMVNPTPPSLDFTKYFFPSKTMEYLAVGTPTIMFRLECMPREYDKYIFYVDEESVEALKKKIISVCEKAAGELELFGMTAQKFILEEKSPFIQCKKILQLMGVI